MAQLTMVSPKIEAGWTVFVVLTIVSVNFCSSRMLSIYSRIEFASVMTGRRLTFPIVAINLETCHFEDICFIDSLHFGSNKLYS